MPTVTTCRWYDNHEFAYSMTYDEGFVECLANALPIHEKHGFPGHVDVVAGQLGKRRSCYLSSLNDYVHMSVDELRFLQSKGWGVGNHSDTHFVYPYQPGLNLWKEVVWSKYRLEDSLGRPVRIFTIPNDKYNYDVVIPLVKEHYAGCVYIDGGPNKDDVDLYKIGNFLVASGNHLDGSSLFDVAEPYDWKAELRTPNLNRELLRGTWLLDTTHVVAHAVPQQHKNVTPEDLDARFQKLKDISRGDLWAATPDQVVDYILTRRNTSIVREGFDADRREYSFDLSYEPVVGCVSRVLTFQLGGIDYEDPQVQVDRTNHRFPAADTTVEVRKGEAGIFISLEVMDGLHITMSEKRRM